MGRQELRVLFIEPFYGGSHRDVADGLVASSRHTIDLLTLPDRFWKWRMRGASLWFANRIARPARDLRPLADYDLLFCTGLMDIAALTALLGNACPPVLLYCHETQLAYPQPKRRDADLHFAFTDLVNMVCADRVLFNSHSHRSRFLEQLPQFLRSLPEYRPMWTVDAVTAKSDVCYPGIALPPAGAEIPGGGARPGPVPLIIWNHRWEHDKAPEKFFRALDAVASGDLEFRVALLGENFATQPESFKRARASLGERIVQFGYEPDAATYRAWLQRGAIVVSTALQENFGISVMEAVAYGCHPVLPARLSYPELIPPAFHERCLYANQRRLVALLRAQLRHASRELAAGKPAGAPEALVAHARGFGWEQRAAEFDAIMEQVVLSAPRPGPS